MTVRPNMENDETLQNGLCADAVESSPEKRANTHDKEYDSRYHDKDSERNYHDKDCHGNSSYQENDSNTVTSKRRCEIWKFVKSKLSLAQKDSTPLNWKYVNLVVLSLFASAVSLTFLFPFLPEMVLYFGYKEEDKGYYAGLVASAMFAGRACGCYFWGWLSDKIGRRPVMMITIFGNGLFSLLFGFTINLEMAIAMRFLTGMANGTVGTAKTMLYEMCDNTNQAVAMSMLSVSWGAGIILGPAIGGLLSSPAKNYPHVFSADGVFGQFPYLLPSALIFIVCCLVIVIDFIWLPETLESKKKTKEIFIEVGASETEPLNKDTAHAQFAQVKSEKKIYGHSSVTSLPAKVALSIEDLHCESEAATYKVQRQALIQRLKNNSSLNGQKSLSHHDIPSAPCDFFQTNIRARAYSESSHKHVHKHDDQEVTQSNKQNVEEDEASLKTSEGCCTTLLNKVKNMAFISLMSVSDVRQSVFIYSFLSFGIIGFDEVFTVWASTERRLDGLSFDPSEIGAVLGLSFLPISILNLYMFPYLVKKFSLKKTFILCSIFMMVTVTCIPTLHLVQGSKSTMITLVLLGLIPEKIFGACAFSATSIFVNNSSPPGKTGTVNGLSMTCTAITRSFAPVLGGSLYAWTMSYGSPVLGPPFDVSLSFAVFGAIVWINSVYSVYLNEKLNSQSNKK